MTIQEIENRIIRRVWELAEPLCQSEGMELIHVEYRREQSGRILRLYIDKPGGIRVDDCAGLSRQLSDILDADSEFENKDSYNLEVSSPGIERPLGRISDFQKFQGYLAKIRTTQSINGQKKFHGRLEGISEGNILLTAESKTVSIPFEQIARARLAKEINSDLRGEK